MTRSILVIAAASAAVAGSACAQSGSARPDSPVSARLDSVLTAAQAGGFSGVVRVEKDGAVLIEKGYGLANRAANTPFSAGTVVQIGSNTKDFTTVAILQLHEKGRLGLGDSIGRYFPGAPPDKRNITIRQLLNHRAGFPLGLGPDFEPLTRAELVDRAMKFKLLFTPGEARAYSNTGFALLAAIVEQVSGQSYDEHVRDNILRPLGLRDTGFHLPGFDQRRLAHGYRSGGADHGTMLSKPRAIDGPYWNLRGNGGMLSTVGDMHAFYHALFETDKLLRQETRDAWFPPNEPVGLAGSDMVSFFLYERDPIAKSEIIIASNDADHKAPSLRQQIASVLGLPGGDGGGEVVVDDGERTKPAGGPASPEHKAIVEALVKTINSGDREAIRRFIVERFESGEGLPTVDERLERILSMHDNLGALEVLGMSVVEGGELRGQLKSARQGTVELSIDLSRDSPVKIRRMRLRVGSG